VSVTSLILSFALPDPEHSTTARVFLVLGYTAAAWLWWRAVHRTRATEDSFWWRLGAGLLLLLSVNKLFDLRQVSESGLRALAKSGNWYEQRQPVQFAVAIVLPSLLIVTTTIFMASRGMGFFRRHRLALAGWALLVTYLTLRQVLEWKPALAVIEAMGYFDWRLALEVGGIALVMISALIVRPPVN